MLGCTAFQATSWRLEIQYSRCLAHGTGCACHDLLHAPVTLAVAKLTTRYQLCLPYCCAAALCVSLQAGAGSKSRVRELTQQLEEQRSMYTRRIRALEARLTAAEGAAAAASRRASASSSGGFAAGRGHSGAAAGSSRTAAGLWGARPGVRAGRQGSSRAAAAAAGADSSSDGDQAVLDAAAAAAGSEGDEGQLGEGALSACAAGRPAVAAGLLRVRERQMAGLVAQLEERTSQVRRGRWGVK
jgi:hypothetical protein